MKAGDIIIKDTCRGYALKYRIARLGKVGDLLILWGLRVKYDFRKKDWVSFGQEHALLPSQFRLFIEDDFHYMK